MLPGSPASSPPETHLLKKPKGGSPPPTPLQGPKSPVVVPLSLPFRNHRPSIVIFVLAIQLLLLLYAGFHPAHRFLLLRRRSAPSPAASGGDPCPLGRIYVYDLPPVFNAHLLASCPDLSPWKYGCNALSNGGFGPPATDLAGVIPTSLLSSWYSTDQFTAEIIFHRRILAHRCRTTDTAAASAFYIPFYAGLAVAKHLWSSASTPADRDRDCAFLLRWIKDQDPWKRSKGCAHFITLGRITWDFRRSQEGDWGGSFLNMPGMENVTRLLIERNPWDSNDIGIPYPTGFHTRTAADVRHWQHFVMNRPRSTLFGFAGAARASFKNDFRSLLLEECGRQGRGRCRTVDCGGGRCRNRSAETLSLFLDSVFCLQPRGDSFTRRSMFDCMLAGAVPVLFWRRSAYLQYGWYLPTGGEAEWSVFIDRREVRSGAVSVRQVLEEIGEEKARRMRERLVEIIPRLIYSAAQDGLGKGMKDAVDVALEGVLRRFQEQHRRREDARLL